MNRRKQDEVGAIPPFQTYEERRNLGAAKITLDGRPANIVGFRLDWPIIRSKDGELEGEWSWIAVARGIAKGGAFRL